MLNRVDHDPGMALPHSQVARLRIYYSPKSVNPRIQIHRGRVCVGKTGALIESVNEVRAIGGECPIVPRVERGIQNRQPLIQVEWPGR